MPLFIKACPICQQPLEKYELVCARCAVHLNVKLRFECKVCSRDLSNCSLCQNPGPIESVLATFDSSPEIRRYLQKAHSLSGHTLCKGLADLFWVRLIASGASQFDAVVPFSCFWQNAKQSWQTLKGVPLNQVLAHRLAQLLKVETMPKWLWILKYGRQARASSFSLLVVASHMDEKQMQRWTASLKRLFPHLRLTFLIGCWTSYDFKSG
jgi:predicted amidophosphoribosyltransferase